MKHGKGPIPLELLERPPRCPNCGGPLDRCEYTIAVGQESTWGYRCAARVCIHPALTADGRPVAAALRTKAR